LPHGVHLPDEEDGVRLSSDLSVRVVDEVPVLGEPGGTRVNIL